MSTNALVLFISNLLPPAAGFLVVVYIGRYLGATAFGEYMVAYSWYFLLTPIANLGLPSFLIRHLSRLKTFFGPFVVRALLLVFASGTLCGVVMWVSAVVIGYSTDTIRATALLAATMGLTGSVPVLQGILVSQEKAWGVLLSQSVESVVRLGGTLILARLGYGVVWLVGVFVLARSLSAVACLLLLRRHWLAGWRAEEGVELSTIWLLRETLPFAGIAWLNVAYWRIGILILAKLQGEAAVGIFSAANKIFQILEFVPESIMLAFFPRLSRRFVRARAAFERLLELGARYVWAGSLLSMVVVTLVARPVLRITYQLPSFMEAAPVLYVLTWALLAYAGRRFFVRLMMAADLEQLLVKLLGILTVVGIGVNFALSWWLGALGLALATMINMALTAILLGWSSGRRLGLSLRLLDWPRLLGIGLAGVVAGAVGYGLLGIHWIVAAVGTVVVFLAVVFLLRCISLEEIGLSDPAWLRRRG